MKKENRFAINWLWSDIKAGELHLLFIATTVAVMIVTSIGLFGERLQKALVAESSVFLAADVVLRSPDVVNEKWLSTESASVLSSAEVVQFPSMVFSGDEMVLASVKAVSSGYPLRGNLEISEQPFGEGKKVSGGPKAGEAWLDSRLLTLLALNVGDEIWIGERSFRVKHILAREPDSGSSYWSLGPRILISMEDLASTQVVQQGSRVEYRYLFAGDNDALQTYLDWLRPQLQKKHRLLTLQDSQPGLSQSLSRAEHFLLLAGSLGVLLAAIAIAMAARRYSLRHFDAVAIFKVLGMSPSTLKQVLFLPLLAAAMIGILSGWILGAWLQYAFLAIMADWLPTTLPAASWRPYANGALTGITCVMVFALPLLWQLLRVPPLRVLRRDLEGEVFSQRWRYLMGALTIYLLMYFFSKDLRMTSILFAGTLLAGGIISVFAMVLLRNVRRLGSQAGSVWRLAFASLQRHHWHSVLQLVMFTLVLMLLLVSLLIRTSLLKDWQQQLPEGTPNQFLINIAPYQVEPVENFLAEKKIKTAGLYPMVRGRLTFINGIEATTIISEEVDEVYRELNLTWSKSLPEDNQLVAGKWWSPQGDDLNQQVSIEQSLAEKLKISVGSELTFTIGDKAVNVTVSNVRKLSWDRMRPNFYFIFQPGVLESYSATYITSFYLPAEEKYFLNALLKMFPTVSVFSVDEMIRRIQQMVRQVTQAIELVLGLILVAGLLVLIATVQASLDQRLREAALLRSLGAKRALVLGGLVIEFSTLGALAGVLAAAGSAAVTGILQTQIFDMDYVFYFWPWWVGPMAGMLIVGITGLLACAKVVRVPPLKLLQEQVS